MCDIEIIISGFIQGVSEFLPISSSAHLLFLMPNSIFINVILLHFATLFVTICFFYAEIKNLFFGFLDLISFKKTKNSNFVIMILLTFVPILFIGLLFDKFIKLEKNLLLMGYTSIFFGVVLYISDLKKIRDYTEISSYKHAIVLGFIQTIAIIPGTSRLGITLSCLRALGYDRQLSVKLSLIISIPVMATANLWFLMQNFLYQNQYKCPFSSEIFISCVIAIIFGFITINIFYKQVAKESTLKLIAIYRILFGLFLINF